MIYRYDGSFEGFLCCVFDSYARHELPEDILPEWEEQTLLYPEWRVQTDPERAARVFAALSRKISRAAEEMISTGFLCGLPGKELVLLQFIRKGLREGGRITGMLGDEAVSRVYHMVRAVGNESHLMRGFLRFSEYRSADGKRAGLAAVIEPKHYILSQLGPHFADRYPGENFLIYDRTHGAVLIYCPYEFRIVPADDFAFPPADETELQYRRLWRQYYTSIGIEARYNPRCRMSHMPKRFWNCMTELQEQSFPVYGRQKLGEMSGRPALEGNK